MTEFGITEEELRAIAIGWLHTAGCLTEALAAPLVTDPRLCERDVGVLTGLTFAEVYARYPEWSGTWQVANDEWPPIPGEEGPDALAVLVTGFVGAVFTVARQAYVTEAAPPLMRARALSTLAGTQRIGTFIGPFAGALAIHLTSTRGAYWLAVALCLVAAAVVLPPEPLIEFINDSKKLSAVKREKLAALIREEALAYGVGWVFQDEIDEINILNAAKRAFASALSQLSIRPDHVFCDRIGGIDVPYPYEELVDGDAKVYSIAAASIVAKVTRDRLMRSYECVYPNYGFARHKGYATRAHAECIRAYGPCAIHRRSFLTRFGV